MIQMNDSETDVNLNIKLLSLVNFIVCEGSDHCRIFFFLPNPRFCDACFPNESAKKAFYCFEKHFFHLLSIIFSDFFRVFKSICFLVGLEGTF